MGWVGSGKDRLYGGIKNTHRYCIYKIKDIRIQFYISFSPVTKESGRGRSSVISYHMLIMSRYNA